MKKNILNIVMMLIICIVPISSYAFANPDPNYVLHVTVTNETKSKLTFDRVLLRRPDSEYYVSPQVIYPGESTDITVIKSELKHNDVEGFVIFDDADGYEIPLLIHDPEQVHIVQPKFEVFGHENKYKAQGLVKKSNPNRKPRYLLYLSASFSIVER